LSIGYGPLAVGRWPALLVPILMIYLMPLVHSKKYSKKRRVPVPVANEGGQVKTLPANCATSVSDSEVEENITDLHDEVFSSPVVLKGIGKTQKTQVFINPFKCGIQFILSLFRLPKRENLD